MSYLYIFLQSNLLEIPFYLYLLRRQTSPIGWLQGFTFITLMNSVTHPVVFFLIMNLKLTYLQNILLAESFAVIAETAFLIFAFGAPKKSAFIVSLLANLASWQIAPAITYLVFK